MYNFLNLHIISFLLGPNIFDGYFNIQIKTTVGESLGFYEI